MKGGLMKTKRATLVARVSISLILCGILVIWGFQASAEEWTAAQKEIWSIQKKAWELWKKGEMGAFKELFHEDCIIWFSRYGVLWDKTAHFHTWPSWIESFDLQPFVVKVFGDVAIVKYISDYETPSWKSKARFTNIWKKQNGKWKILLEMANDCEKPVPPCP